MIDSASSQPALAPDLPAASTSNAPPLHPSTIGPPQAFPRFPGETPRAFGAFITYFQLGQSRSLAALADTIGEGLPTIKNWSSKYRWTQRLHDFHSALLEQQVTEEASLLRRNASQWSSRLDRFREQEWDAAQKLLVAAQCFLENVGEEDLRKMTLAQAANALKTSSALGRAALVGAELPEPPEPVTSSAQQQLLDAVTRVYGQKSVSPSES